MTEHRLHQRRCRCGHLTRAQAPAGVNAPACYGPNLRALAAYLLVYQHIPVARTAELIADLTGARPSTGWVSSTLTPTAAALAPANAMILDEIRAAPVVHVDETSSNINGTRWWLHVVCSAPLTPGTDRKVQASAVRRLHPDLRYESDACSRTLGLVEPGRHGRVNAASPPNLSCCRK